MDARFLTTSAFWENPTPFAAGHLPADLTEFTNLAHHVLFGTSGTMGAPKWIALSKAALLASATAVNEHLQVTAESCWGLALPRHHVGGFGVAARAFVAGCGFHAFENRWNAADFVAWLQTHGITHTSLVPTQVHDLVKAGLTAPACLQAVVVGGGHLDAHAGQAARNLGWPVLASFGMTEAASQIATQSLAALDDIYQPAPLPLLPIWQAETSSDGTLRIAGPALFSGTLVQSDGRWNFQSRTTLWHQTEDRVNLSNRNLTPIGRSDALVKVLGELVDPDEIERELIALSGSELRPGSFIIAARPDERAGHVLVPVFAADISRDVMHDALAAYALRAPGFRRLMPPVIMEDFPTSALGKAKRAEITARLAWNA